ncbi:MAG: hypothetical protein AAF555_09915 [Verrucomicrobiota bacterium]
MGGIAQEEEANSEKVEHRVVQGTTTQDFTNIGDVTQDLTPFTFDLENGESLTFAVPDGGTGWALDALTFTATVVPEPTTSSILGIAAIVLCLLRPRRTKAER